MWKCGVHVDPDNDSCQTLSKCMARYINVFANNGLSDAAIFLRPGSVRENWMRVKTECMARIAEFIQLEI